MKIGLVADSLGDIDALEYACDFLIDERGAERIFFLGGNWGDLDELFARKRAAQRGRSDYSDMDFLADVASFVARTEEQERGGVAHKVKKEGLEAYLKRFVRVPDKQSVQYRDPAIVRVLPDLIGDRISFLVHDKGDLTREDIEAATFLVHGNSAEANVVQIGPRFFITPGRLTDGAHRSCALLTWEGSGAVEFVAFGLDGRELKKLPLSLVTRRKMSAH